MYKIIIFVFLFLRITAGIAQGTVNSAVVEQKSTALYLKGNWAELVKYGNNAIALGYDYFYLRMRIGIAYYVQKKYMKAAVHFEKAVEFNSSDHKALEYLYYSYIFSGRNSEARALTSKFPSDLRDSIQPPKNKFVESLYTEGGIALSSLNDNFKNIDIDGPSNIYGDALITKNMQYLNIAANHQLGSKFSVYQGYSNIKIDYTRDIKRNNIDTADNYTLTQQEYYISPVLQCKGFSFAPAFHFISVNFGKLNAAHDLIYNKYIFTKKDTSFINYAASFSVIKNIGIYTYNLSAGFSQLNGFTQIQTGLSLTYYPSGSPNFYGTSELVYLNEDNTNRVIATQKLGLKLGAKLWAEAGITYGNLQNYSENNALVVYNTGDKILYKYGFSITSPLLKHFEFSLRYNFFNRENIYFRTNYKMHLVWGIPNYYYENELVTVNYNTQAIIGGIKWKL